MATEKPKTFKKKKKGIQVNAKPILTERELALPYGNLLAAKNKQDSPFLKEHIKSTPVSTMGRLMNLEKKKVEDLRKLSVENKERKALLNSEKQRILEEDIQLLTKGTTLLKVPHRGPARKTKFFIKHVQKGNQWYIYWASKNKSREETMFPLKECLCALGQGQGLFKERSSIGVLNRKKDEQGHSRLSFTLMFQERTVDVMAETQEDFDRWCRVLRYVGVILDTHSGYT